MRSTLSRRSTLDEAHHAGDRGRRGVATDGTACCVRAQGGSGRNVRSPPDRPAGRRGRRVAALSSIGANLKGPFDPIVGSSRTTARFPAVLARLPAADPSALDVHEPIVRGRPAGSAIVSDDPGALLDAVNGLRAAATALEAESARDLQAALPEHRDSLANLLHYLALRRLDLRDLQDALGRRGLSSLGRMEAHVMPSLDAVAAALDALAGRSAGEAVDPAAFDRGDALLADNAVRAFGPEPVERHTRIMVTLPTAAADDPTLVRDLIAGGMDLARINAAHDDAATWARMIARLRAAERELGRRCRVAMDLAGPKLRTGPVEPGDAVLRRRPRRDALGRVLEPAAMWLVPADRDGRTAPDEVPVDRRLLQRVRVDDTFALVDARGRNRVLTVTAVDAGRCLCQSERTIYLVPGTPLLHRRGRRTVAEGEVGSLPAAAGSIALRPGDRLDLRCGSQPGHAARFDLDGRCIEPATISCDVARLFERLRPGERVLFDDGTITATVREVSPRRAVLSIVHCAGGQARLKADKGINVPDTLLDLPALTDQDRADLGFALAHADLVSASFVQRPEDVDLLRESIAAAGATSVAIVLKIETTQAFARLPELLVASLRHPSIAVMAARGDLAVEVGFERLAEVQEEILWLCEAAHVPVIWATQVLDSLARDGLPSRAEVTDAAMAGRAECVMLNKGPFIRETLAFLDGVLSRMRQHQRKKTAMLRRLSVAQARR